MVNARNTLGSARTARPQALLFGLVLALVALAMLAGAGAGQDTATDRPAAFQVLGVVVDGASGAVLDGAWVGISGTDWGSITNDEGRFRIPDHRAGPLHLTVERIGYETLEWSGEVTSADDLLEIRLESKPLLLEGLRVVTDRFETRRRATATSTRAFDAGDLASATEDSALDFVSYRTSGAVACDRGLSANCLWIRGRAYEPTVYIDEMPVLAGLDYLDAFRPWEFHMIEIYGNGRHIRAYTTAFMQRAAEVRLMPLPIFD